MTVLELPQFWSETDRGEIERPPISASEWLDMQQSLPPTYELGLLQTVAQHLFAVVSGLCLFIADLTLVASAFVVAYAVRFIMPDLERVAVDVDQYARMGVLVGLIATVLLAFNGFYDEERNRAWPARVQRIVSSVSTALVLAVALSFFTGNQPLSRLWFAFSWGFAILCLTFWRSIADGLNVPARAAFASTRRVVVVGANSSGEELANELAGSCRVVGFVDNGTDLSASRFSLLGPIAQLEQIVAGYCIDDLVIALPANRCEQISRIIARGFSRRVTIKFLPGMNDILPSSFDVQRFAGRHFIGFSPAARVSWLKRAADLLLGSAVLVALVPLFLVIVLLIKLDSPGPIFYGQTRVGKDGRRFRMLKFRSMHQNAERLLSTLAHQNEAIGPLFKMRNDPRVTCVGRVLRRLSLDELPQIFNVIKGEMSLVGPRPPLPSEVAKYEDWQLGRLRAVPGMTGLWQVSGRSEVGFHDMVRLDLHYIRNWSLALDLEILLRTIPAVLASRGAY